MLELFCGVDLVEIERVERALRHPRFLTRFFGPAEQSWLEERGFPVQSAAGCFCAKEAFAKALGTGIRGFSLREAELLRDSLGKPYLAFSGRALEIVRSLSLRFDVSISHTRRYAVAQVVAWREDDRMEGTPCG